MGEQRAGPAGVLGRDHVGVAQRLDGPRRRGRRGCRSASRPARACRRDPAHGSRAAGTRRRQDVADVQVPARERRRPRASSARRARQTTRDTRPGAIAATTRSTRPSAAQNATSIANRIPNVCTWRHGSSTSTPSMPSRPSSPRRRGPAVGRDLGRRRATAVADEHAACVRADGLDVEADLEDVAVDHDVVLALDPQLAQSPSPSPTSRARAARASRSPRPG